MGSKSSARPPAKAKPAPPSPVEAFRSLLAQAKRDAGDPCLGTVAGRLRAAGEIDDRQFGAAEAYARLRGRFSKATGMPRRTPKAAFPDLAAASSGRQIEMVDAAFDALKAEHAAALAVARHDRFLLDRTLLEETEPLPCELERLRPALDRLAVHFDGARPR